jgi:hypothetical protein
MLRSGGFLAGAFLAVMAAFAPSCAQAQQSPETWRPVEFRQPSAQERRIVEQVYGTFLRGAPDTSIEIARIDIDGDRVAELVVRMSHPRLCGANGCHTALLQAIPSRSGQGTWQPLMERRSRAFETGAMSEGRPAGLRIRVNGREVWERAPNGLYVALPSGFGAEVVLRPNPPQPVLREVARAVASDIGAPADLREVGNQTFAGVVDLAPAGRFWIAQTSAMGVCGQVGCPVLVIVADGQPRVIGRFSALEGSIHVGRWANGEPLIAAGSPLGVTLYAIVNNRLVIRETTFPSEATPAP